MFTTRRPHSHFFIIKDISKIIFFNIILLISSCTSKHRIESQNDKGHQNNMEFMNSVDKTIITEDVDSVIAEYKKSAIRGDADAMYFLGVLYNPNQQLLGGQLPKDYYTGAALEWYKRAAMLGNIDAMHEVASFYAEGIETEKNLEKAYYWYSQGYRKAPHSFALNMYYVHMKGLGCKKDINKAQVFLKKVKEAANKDGKLAYDLGKCYFNGSNDIPIDSALGEKWLKKAYELGYIFAKLELTLMEKTNTTEEADSFLLLLQERNKIRSKKN